MKKRLLYIFLCFAFLYNAANVMAQPTQQFPQGIDPGCGVDVACGDPNCPCSAPQCAGAPAPCPIDGGLGFLVAAGIGLGARRSMRRKKSE